MAQRKHPFTVDELNPPMKYERIMNGDPSVGDTVAIISPWTNDAEMSVTYGIVTFVNHHIIQLSEMARVTKVMEDAIDREYADTYEWKKHENPYALLYHLVPVDRKK